MKQAGLIGTGVISAIAASLCCITPLIALIAGSSGAAASLSWLAPARPFLTGLTILALGFAWYQKLKPAKTNQDNCGCQVEKPSFIQSKLFLAVISGFAIIMLALPYYSHFLYQSEKKNVAISNISSIQMANFNISGMGCEGCEGEIKYEVNKLPGVVATIVSYKQGNAVVKFDSTKTTLSQIQQSINSTGYKVTSYNYTK